MPFHKQLHDYDFFLPEALIAQHPAEPRGSSRLLHLTERREIVDRTFSDVLDLLQSGDVLVFNDTKVIAALLTCSKRGFPDKIIDINLLKEVSDDTWQVVVAEDTWEGIDKDPYKELDIGDELIFNEYLSACVIDKNLAEKYSTVQFSQKGESLLAIFQAIGNTPLPPYIKRDGGPTSVDALRYQTVFSKNLGAVAAPTAGLHFTQAMLDALKEKGVESAFVTLHVGAGTFFPVKTESIEQHIMHSEAFLLSDDNSEKINKAKREGRRIIPVGTTSLRVLESCATEEGYVRPSHGMTSIFLKEAHEFKVADALITNFHTPKSTLFILVCGFCGYEVMHKVYCHAIEKEYKFFSYGDACFLEKG